MKKIAFLLIVFTFIHCSSDSSDSSDSSNSSDPSVENNTSNQEPIAYSCEDVQEALNKVYLAYSEVEAGSLPSPGTLDSFLDWPLLFNEKLRENPAYNNIISSVTEFDELINTYPDCLDELE